MMNKRLCNNDDVQQSLQAVYRTGDVPQKLVNRHPARVELWIYNDGDQKLFIAPSGPDVGKDLFSMTIQPDETLIMNPDHYGRLYDQDIVGFWDEAASYGSRAMITEYYV
jgi:hypothetical protein